MKRRLTFAIIGTVVVTLVLAGLMTIGEQIGEVLEIHTGLGAGERRLRVLDIMLDLVVRAKGDLHIDAHHTVEDIGITLGQALKAA